MREFLEATENLTKDELYSFYTAGMVIVLPCLPKTTIYKLTEAEDGGYEIITCCLDKAEIVENLELFGEVYFTEKEEAEKALAETERN